MDIKKLSKITKEIKSAYAELNRKGGRPVFNVKDYADVFVGDVGDLVKFLGSYSRKPNKESLKKIKHELGDCLWSVLVIADELGVDIEKEFLINMAYLKQKYFEKRSVR
jgi:NTP pyrophosphatase (non-canonical NTP hydrolase)